MCLMFLYPSIALISPALSVKVTINGVDGVEMKTLPRHKKNPDCGNKETLYGPDILVEQEDAQSFEDNEEVRPSFSGLTPGVSPIILSDHSNGLGQCLCSL
jgi:hypothetical protein